MVARRDGGETPILFPAERVLSAYLAMASVTILILRPVAWIWMLSGHLVLMALLAIVVRHRGSDSVSARARGIAPLLLFGPLYVSTGRINAALPDWILDGHLARLEGTIFGCQPSQVLAERLPSLLLSEVAHAGYFLYFFLVAALPLTLLARRRTGELIGVVTLLTSCFSICLVCYLYLPVVSPLYLDPPIGPPLSNGFFFRLTHKVADLGGVVGGAFPSSHAALSTLSLLLAFRLVRRLAWGMLLPTVALLFATVYGRYHFALDTLTGILLGSLFASVSHWKIRALRHVDRGTMDP